MNIKKSMLVAACVILFTSPASACPTCVARIEKNAPPFFEDEDVQNISSSRAHIPAENKPKTTAQRLQKPETTAKKQVSQPAQKTEATKELR